MAHVLVGGEAVLGEVQRAAGLQHAADLAQGGVDVGDRAHRPGRERGVEAVVRERQRRAVEAGALGPARRLPSRFAASFQPTSAGSTAATPVTAAG